MTMDTRPLAIFLMGPTASGKTDLAIALREHLPVDLISVDSALIYKGMDIGTAKPSAAELALAPHRLIDIKDPSEAYSAANFSADALAQMEQIHANGRIPLLVGGTMLYFKALLEGLSPLPSADPVVRAEIEKQAAEQGWQALHDELNLIDPVSAARIHPNDPQRLSRAIEVFRITGETLTTLTQQKSPPLPFRTAQFAIAPELRSDLHQRIETRFLKMLEQGFEQEVRTLYQRGDLHPDLPSIRCVGYRQMWAYLEGDDDYSQMVSKGVAATRQLAKRQITWLRGWQQPLYWLHSEADDNVTNVLDNLASNFGLVYK